MTAVHEKNLSSAVALAAIASAIGAVGIALWLVPASVQIVAWRASGPERVAYFAPLARLWWIGGVAAVVLVVIAALKGPPHTEGPRHTDRPRGLGAAAHVVAPLQWLWLWTVPFWPVVPDRLPLLLILAGPLRWMIAAAALLAVAARARRRPVLGRLVLGGSSEDENVESPPHRRRGILRGRGWGTVVVRRTVFGLSFALYLAVGLTWNTAAGFSGDEPHYLVIAHSLLVDHDLNVENNHARRDYAGFYPGTLRPDYLARGRHGEIYSIHAPGLPALLLPAYATAGARGAVVFMALMAALAALAIFDTARLLAGPASGWVTWAAIALTVPVVPHAWLIYPEIAALLVVAWAVRWLVAPVPDGAGRWVARGAAMAALPWLHTKYAILLTPLALFIAADAWRRGTPATRIRRIVAFSLPIAVSLGAWLVSFYVMYGVFDPQAPYGSYTAMYVRTANIARSVLGLLIDQKFGLLVYAPVYLLAFLAAPALWCNRDRRLLTWTIAVTAALFVASTARFYMWWGGASAPARFAVPVLPLAGPLVAIAVLDWRRFAAVTLSASLAISLTAMARPSAQILFSDPHGTSRTLAWLQGNAPLTSAWPTFTEPEWRPQIGRALGALAGHFEPQARADTAEHGRESLLLEYNAGQLRAFDYPQRARADEAFVLSHAMLTRTRADGQLNADPARLAGPFNLAAGEYTVRVWYAGEPAAAFVHYHRSPAIATFAPAATADRANATVGGAIRLPVDAPVIWVGVNDEASASRVTRVDVMPLAIVPRSNRVAADPIAIEPLDQAGLLVYADRNAYPEGGVFWTRGTSRATVYVAPGAATNLKAILHVGPHGGTVKVTVGGEARHITIPDGGTAELSVPLNSGSGLVRVTIEAPASFVPAITDPHVDDTRRLGCQVRILLS